MGNARIFPQFLYIVGDVRNPGPLAEAIPGVDYVFYAAALKQVPACENYPFEAVKTNVVGSQNVCDAAKYNRVKCLVALSTDKAVKPINAMGISKAMLEKIVCSQNQFGGQTTFCCVRYGNVRGSREFNKGGLEGRVLRARPASSRGTFPAWSKWRCCGATCASTFRERSRW